MRRLKANNRVSEAQARVAAAEQKLDETSMQIATRFEAGTIAGNAAAHFTAHRAGILSFAIALYRFRSPILSAIGTGTALILRKRQERKLRQSYLDSPPSSALILEQGSTDMSDNLKETIANAGHKIESIASSAVQKGQELGSKAQHKAEELYHSSRKDAEKLGERLISGIRDNPGTAIVGGLAVGALVAALLPRKSKTEQESAEKKSKQLARNAKEKISGIGHRIDDLGINRDSAKEGLSKLREAASQVASSAKQSVDRVKRKG